MTTISTSQLSTLVQTSFLPESVKDVLLRNLKSDTQQSDWIKKFDDALVTELQKRERTCIRLLEELEQRTKPLREQAREEEEKIEQRTKTALKSVGNENLSKRQDVWKKYYQELQAVSEKFRAGVRAVLSEILLRVPTE